MYINTISNRKHYHIMPSYEGFKLASNKTRNYICDLFLHISDFIRPLRIEVRFKKTYIQIIGNRLAVD